MIVYDKKIQISRDFAFLNRIYRLANRERRGYRDEYY